MKQGRPGEGNLQRQLPGREKFGEKTEWFTGTVKAFEAPNTEWTFMSISCSRLSVARSPLSADAARAHASATMPAQTRLRRFAAIDLLLSR